MSVVEFHELGALAEEDALVVSWRAEELLRAGYEGEAALDLALTREVDLHRAIDLVRHGCPHATAVRILL